MVRSISSKEKHPRLSEGSALGRLQILAGNDTAQNATVTSLLPARGSGYNVLNLGFLSPP